MNYYELLREGFNERLSLKEKRPGITQLIAPLYHEDGDMMDIFLEKAPNGENHIRVSDHGMTLMRLSYSFDLNTENKERIFQRIISENGVQEADGNLFIDTRPESLYSAVLQFAHTVCKISNMRLYKRAVIESLFYELLTEFVESELREYGPKPNTLPILARDDLEVDFELEVRPHPLFLFGAKDVTKSRLVTISCLEFRLAGIPFKSAVVHMDYESLPRKDISRITSAVDKQFITLDDFKQNGPDFIKREAA